jgi:hypothetical protein
MTMTAMGLFDGFSEAQRLIRPLLAQGVWSEDITIIANREETSISDVLAAAAWGVNVDVGPASRGQPAALIAFGVPADKTQRYASAIDDGGALVCVVVAEDHVEQALALIEQHGAADLAAPEMRS